ncbi:DUF2971 domain-containing protein [Vibrio alginolyticus]|uniref:DUF2971 domain-containing protein n=1 Tax=Vibrio alginolyticus TaxID=663 RepID=UPI00215FE376|nr:DUF2971 domain-containing protein [Vibrio alginolyticus]MCS0179035.1 DUF2971 domain-containing protein [Vibrio alginolyticus]
MKFYKYMALNKNTLDAFINEYCWFSSPSAFNDPFDCGLIKGDKMKEFFLESKKILCLAREHDNLLMWSHYADPHRGICVEYTPFSTEEICSLKEQGVFGDFPNDRLCIVQNARKVEYRTTEQINNYLDALPDTDQEFLSLHQQKIEEGSTEDFYATISSALTIKHESWAYENEYRIIHDGENRNTHPGKITKIYIGAKASPQDKRTLSMLIDESIELVCMDFSKTKYSLTERSLEPKVDFAGLGLYFKE